MTNLVRRDPFTDIRSTMDRLFDEGFYRPRRFVAAPVEVKASFPIEVSETEDDIELKASLPGIRPDEVDISVANDVLTIKAEHKETTEEKKREFYRREIRYGSYSRALTLPVSVDADKAEARFENGVLHLRLPKAEANRPKQIKVSAHEAVEGGASAAAGGSAAASSS